MQLETGRFLLRDFTDADAAAFKAYRSDPRSHEFSGAVHASPAHAEELIRLFREWAADEPRLNCQLAIVQRSGQQALIGCCGLRSAGAAPGTAELGIELAPEYWGRFAYAVEVMQALVEFGFGALGLQTISGGTVSANSRIARLASSFGATAVVRPAPGWMAERGWTKVEWRLNREDWESSHRTWRARHRADEDRRRSS